MVVAAVVVVAVAVWAFAFDGLGLRQDAEPTSAPDPTATEPAQTPEPVEPEQEDPEPTEDGSDADQAPPLGDLLLPAEEEPREVEDGPTAWVLPADCEAVTPQDPTAMVTARDGTGEFEAQIDVQQIAAFADGDALAQEWERAVQALEACSTDSDLVSTEALDIPDETIGISAYFGDGEGGATPFGTYATLGQRGNLMMLITVEGGEGTPETGRDQIVERTLQAWEVLCSDENAGC
ncbi:hypothetical protein N869_02060 [Cellulomonas bogoriensis 69B4 = DSM 16987]|uniref:Uncharacterized protein n=1 Tax=Cellulomonas bogoriensis 69B4 = DSM 16987 TaxID=1386082 RepID=A0A0A0BLX1_9CELL|nr:hypothetical protein N869_02060 [Cellulomonas bogoriensis 69B4 = DSM 16987]